MPTKVTRRRPEHDFGEVLAGVDLSKPTDKRFTSMKAATSEGGDELKGGVYRPTAKELEKINQFTKSTKTADDVVVLPTMSANDIRDRDLDKFKTSCIRSFAKMSAPLSPTGKPFMVSHDSTKLPVGRIFDTGTKRVDDSLFLTNKVYMPNTDQYKSFIENVDFGIYWAVSVGVSIGKSECTVGKPHPFAGRWWCSAGHEKGLYYDPESQEKDSWGWPEPVEEGTKGAVLAACDFDDPTDFYELSQVYLGAQYFAELGKSPDFADVVKSAKLFPVIGLREKEAERLPMSHIPAEVIEARKAGHSISTDDGTYRWKSSDGFLYLYDPSEGEVLCLGKQQTTENRLEPLEHRKTAVENKLRECKLALISKADDTDDDNTSLAEAVDATLDSLRTALDAISGADDDENYQQASDLLTAAEEQIDQLVEALGGDDPDDEDEDEEDTTGKGATAPVTKKAVQEAAKAVRLPSSILDKLAAADDDKALMVLATATAEMISASTDKIKQDEPMVKAGTAYIDDLKASVKSSYIRCKQLGDLTKGVNTDRIERLIELAGNDTELLKAMAEDYETDLKKQIGPLHTVRSSFPDDPHNPTKTGSATDPVPEAVGAENGKSRLSIVSRYQS